MNQLVIGIILFFAVHSVSIVNDAWRNRMVEKIGEWPWKGLYALIAVAGLVLIVQGYGIARQDPVVVYVPPEWLRPVSLLLLLPVFPLLLAAYLPGRIQTAARHPMLAATKFWALAHLLSNGTVADLLLFGAFLVWAVADRISLKYRAPHPVPHIPRFAFNDVTAVVAGLALYAAFTFGLHGWLFGVPVLR